MTDNVALNVMTGGETVATDDDGTSQHQYVKVEYGADNTQTKVTGTAGLPVSGTATVTGSVAITNTGSIKQATSPWITSGTATITGSAYVTGSVSISTPQAIGSFTSMALGSSTISNFSVLGSTRVIDSPETVGSLAVQTVSGIVNLGSAWGGTGSIHMVNSLSVDVGSKSYLYGISGTNVGVNADWHAIAVISGTDGGVIRTESSITTGSESWIKGGSILTYDPIGVGSVRVIGQSGGTLHTLLTDNEGVLQTSATVSTGSETYLYGKSGADWYPLLVESGTTGILKTTASVTTGSEVWVKGGSIVNYSGTNYVDVTNFGDLGSTRVIDSPNTIGSFTNMNLGSFAITNIGSVIQSTNPWVVSGNVMMSGVISNFGDMGSLYVSKKDDTNYTKITKQTIRHTVGSTILWVPTNTKKAVITDLLCSVGSPTNEITVWAGGSKTFHTYLAENGGFVTNLQTPIETQTNGSIWFQTSSIGSASCTLTGYEV